jgi:hypothetical protein
MRPRLVAAKVTLAEGGHHEEAACGRGGGIRRPGARSSLPLSQRAARVPIDDTRRTKTFGEKGVLPF